MRPPLPHTIPTPTTHLLLVARRGLDDDEPERYMPQAKRPRTTTQTMDIDNDVIDCTQEQRQGVEGRKRSGMEIATGPSKRGNYRSASVPRCDGEIADAHSAAQQAQARRGGR